MILYIDKSVIKLNICWGDLTDTSTKTKTRISRTLKKDVLSLYKSMLKARASEQDFNSFETSFAIVTVGYHGLHTEGTRSFKSVVASDFV